MAVRKILRKASDLATNPVGGPNWNTVRVDPSTDTLVFGTGTSGTTEKTVTDSSTLANVLTVTGITAFAGGGQTSATALTGQFNRVATVATAADSVRLPVSVAGLLVMIDNRGANSLQVFGAGTDTINGIATATGVAQPVNSVFTYYCYAAGTWETTLSWIGTSVAVTAGLTSSGATGAGIGYATGAGGAVTQLTNRTTGVTLNTLTGTITTSTASLAAEASAVFTVTNSTVAIGDVVVTAQQSGSNGGMTQVEVTTVAAGSFAIKVLNNNAAGGTAETGAILINFAVIKAVSA